MPEAEKILLFSAYCAYPEEFKTMFLYFKTYLFEYLFFHILQAALFNILDLSATSAYYVMPVAFRPVNFVSLKAFAEVYACNKAERFHKQQVPVDCCQVRFFQRDQTEDLFRTQGRIG